MKKTIIFIRKRRNATQQQHNATTTTITTQATKTTAEGKTFVFLLTVRRKLIVFFSLIFRFLSNEFLLKLSILYIIFEYL